MAWANTSTKPRRRIAASMKLRTTASVHKYKLTKLSLVAQYGLSFCGSGVIAFSLLTVLIVGLPHADEVPNGAWLSSGELPKGRPTQVVATRA